MTDNLDIEEFLEKNESTIKDYDSYVEALVARRVSGTYSGGFGLYAPVKNQFSKEEEWEIIKSIIINQGTTEGFQDYFNKMGEEEIFNKIGQLVGYDMNEEILETVEKAQPLVKDRLINFIINNEVQLSQEIWEGTPGYKELSELLGPSLEDMEPEQLENALAIINSNLDVMGSAAMASYYGYDNDGAAFNFNYVGGTTGAGPVYKSGMAQGILRSMTENEVSNMQSKLIEAGYLSPFTAYTLFDASDEATQLALETAMGEHNTRKDGTPMLDKGQQSQILRGLISTDLSKVLIDKLNMELDKDVKKLGTEERTRLYGVNELTLSAATDRADIIAEGVLGRDVDMITAGRLAKVYQDIYDEKYKEGVQTALDKMTTGRKAELQRIESLQKGESVEETRFVGIPSSSETESVVPDTSEIAQQASESAQLAFQRRLKDTYFAQEIDDNERKSAITQASIGFNTALRTLSG